MHARLLVRVNVRLVLAHFILEDDRVYPPDHVTAWLRRSGFDDAGDGLWAVAPETLQLLDVDEYEIIGTVDAPTPSDDFDYVVPVTRHRNRLNPVP